MIRQIKFEKPISVSEYISIINRLLKNVEVKVKGEITGLKKATSGHYYFSLKDEKSGEIINCALWRSVYNMQGVKPEEGMEVIVAGSSDIYGVRGTLTFIIKTIEPVGEGALKKAYEKLKAKLQAEGFFDEERKKDIPLYPQKIGVITSMKGAVVHDFVSNLDNFGFKVLFCDTRVEGQEAVQDIFQSLQVMRKKEVDVLVIIRGGGSLQSLMAFDNEKLVQEVASFPVPVISGIGHHEDVPLMALASDAHYSTPTAVANKLSSGFQKAKEKTSFYEEVIEKRYEKVLYEARRKMSKSLENTTSFLFNISQIYYRQENKLKEKITGGFTHLLTSQKNTLSNKEQLLFSSLNKSIKEQEQKIKNLEKIMTVNNPERQLSLGYAIIRKEGSVIKSINKLSKNDTIDVTISDGKLTSKIINIKKKNNE